jgi:hypothetical protein
MSLIVDINPVPWEILDLVKARILKNRANRQKRQPEKPGELRRVMQVDNGLLAKQRWEEPSFIMEDIVKSIVIENSWTFSGFFYTLTSMTEPVVDGPLGWGLGTKLVGTKREAKYITWEGEVLSQIQTETITLGRPKSKEEIIPEDKSIDTFVKDYPDAEFVKFSLVATRFGGTEGGTIGREVIVRVKVNVDEPDEATILEQKMVALVQDSYPIVQSLGILKVYLDRYYAEFE